MIAKIKHKIRTSAGIVNCILIYQQRGLLMWRFICVLSERVIMDSKRNVTIFLLIQLSHKVMSKSQPVVTKKEKHHSEGKNIKNIRRTLHTIRKRKWYKQYSGKGTSPKKQKYVWLSGRLHIEGRLNEGPRLQREHKDGKRSKAKQSKTTQT